MPNMRPFAGATPEAGEECEVIDAGLISKGAVAKEQQGS
tara:strand:- start:3396 stop:3512 length:117 start_codon:yes stop_codon:yes gene_type:complete